MKLLLIFIILILSSFVLKLDPISKFFVETALSPLAPKPLMAGVTTAGYVDMGIKVVAHVECSKQTNEFIEEVLEISINPHGDWASKIDAKADKGYRACKLAYAVSEL